MKNLVFILVVVLVSIKVVCFCFNCVQDTGAKINAYHEAIEQASNP